MASTKERENFVYTAKLAEQAERYDEMVDSMKKVANLDVELTIEERNLLSVGYKNVIGARRASWRILSSIEQKEESKGNEQNARRIKEYRQKVESELTSICNDIMTVIDEHLIPSSTAGESTVFYYKMKGDYYRYLAEFKNGNEKKEAADQSLKAYQTASTTAEADLSPTHPIRLGLALNFSVFYYEIMNSPERACHLAKQAFATATAARILEISSGLLGRHNIYNILAAVAVGIAVGAPLEDIVRGIEEVDGVPGRCELIDEEQAFGVIVDYAHTPDALSRLLDTVRELGPRRIITVFGCAGESDRGKRPLMTKIATDKSDVTMLTSDNPKSEDPLDILDDMLAGVGLTMQDYLRHGENDYYPPLPNGHRLFLHDIRRVAVRAAVAMGEEGDIVVVAGKGHETYQLEGSKEEFFDDREECREALQYVDELHQAGIDTSEFPWRLPESH